MRVVGSALRRRPMLGAEGLIGQVGWVQAWEGRSGTVSVHGEEWQAESGESLARGDTVEVLGRAGTLRLRVRRSEGGAKP
jgi:membrane-bound ClpP family serine protease